MLFKQIDLINNLFAPFQLTLFLQHECQTRVQHERHRCDTSATQVRHKQYECNKSETSTTRVRHVYDTNDTSVTLVINFNFDKDASENIFLHPILIIWQVKDYKERNNFIFRNTFWKCLLPMPNHVKREHHKNWTL